LLGVLAGVEGADVEALSVEVAPESDGEDGSVFLGEGVPLPIVEDVERESVTYQPLPLNTMPTGWNTLRRLPPHCSHVVRGASEKLWRLSMRSLHDVQV
jgi:hypothetical protein